MKIYGSELVFSSGRRIETYSGIVGLELGETGAIGNVFYGYDGGIDPSDTAGALTKEERIELAEFMISSWMKFYEKQRS